MAHAPATSVSAPAVSARGTTEAFATQVDADDSAPESGAEDGVYGFSQWDWMSYYSLNVHCNFADVNGVPY